MSDKIISMRIDASLHKEMKSHEEINWSAVIRKSIVEYLRKMNELEVHNAQRAIEDIKEIKKSGVFSKGKKGSVIIREWREKRK